MTSKEDLKKVATVTQRYRKMGYDKSAAMKKGWDSIKPNRKGRSFGIRTNSFKVKSAK